jgi:hypothetical protein
MLIDLWSLSSRRVATLLAASAVALTSVLVIVWVQTGQLRPDGDEPHYLIMAESVARDGDFELHNNYTLEALHPRIYGPIDPHVFRVLGNWYSLHGPALGVLLALPLHYGGVVSARLVCCALAGILPFALFLWVEAMLGRQCAVWLTCSSILSIPYIFGSVHIYNDQIAGLLIAALVFGVLDHWERPGPTRDWVAYWVVAGLLPLLMLKFAAPALLLACLALARVFFGHWSRDDRYRILATSGWLLVGLGLLVTYNQILFGTLYGIRDLRELSPDPRHMLMVLCGLHFDQAQGMFMQYPVLLAGLPALGVLVLSRPGLALGWTTLYGSLILPNAMQVITYGGASPSGRFGWSAVWLWFVPVVVVIRDYRSLLLPLVRPIVFVGFAWQLLLSLRWLPTPTVLATVFDARLTVRNSLVPAGLRSVFPSFYTLKFMTFTPNVVALVVAVLLFVTGLVFQAIRGKAAAKRETAPN